MELERVFSCPGTLAKLRSGPLGIHLDGFCVWLLDRGFSRNTIRLHLANVSHLNEHLNRQKAAADKLCATDVAEFLTRSEGDAPKAPVKAGKEQEVKVLHMVMTSDQPRPRVMRRPPARWAAKRLQGACRHGN